MGRGRYKLVLNGLTINLFLILLFRIYMLFLHSDYTCTNK